MRLYRWRTTSILYVNGRCHAGRKDDPRRHFIDVDADRDALSKPHPGEDGVDICDPLTRSLCVRPARGEGQLILKNNPIQGSFRPQD